MLWYFMLGYKSEKVGQSWLCGSKEGGFPACIAVTTLSLALGNVY